MVGDEPSAENREIKYETLTLNYCYEKTTDSINSTNC